MRYNLKPLILARLNELGKARFNSFAADIEKDLEAAVEKTVRELVGPALKRVLKRALREDTTTTNTKETHAPNPLNS